MSKEIIKEFQIRFLSVNFSRKIGNIWVGKVTNGIIIKMQRNSSMTFFKEKKRNS